MSLPPRQAQVLKRIEHSLHACDPHLRSMFAIFAKLTRDEEMPLLEELGSRSSPLRAWRPQLTRPPRRERTGRRAWATGAPGTAVRALILVPITVLVLASAALLGLGAHSTSPCGPAIRPQHTASAPALASPCRTASQGIVQPRLPNG
jgi:hypothetical protein